jgi:hypothetical protein
VQLLGFKPVEALLSHHHIGPSSFLYPDEDSTEGSSRLFLALLERCHLKNKIAVVRIIARQHSVPEMAALIPQMEERREDGFQVLPPGFWVKVLSKIGIMFVDMILIKGATCICNKSKK